LGVVGLPSTTLASGALVPKTVRDFHAEPLGAFTAGETWLYFAFERGPHGYALFGTPGAADMEALIAVLEGELIREPPHTGLVDLRHLEGVRPSTFAALERYTSRHAARLNQIVTHTAMVRPKGLVGVMAEGFFRIVKPPFELSYWTDLQEALGHVGHPAPTHGALALEQARATIVGKSPLGMRLTHYIGEHLLAPTIEGAARACGVSVRTLQRRLASEGTSFARETIQVRIARAKLLLGEGSEPITAIALDIGFATPQHFSAVFKREVGESPGAYRASRVSARGE
jgi:AraC-like DNA-binding protein